MRFFLFKPYNESFLTRPLPLFVLFCYRRWECTVIHGKHLAFKRECSHGERRGRRKKKHTQKANANDTLGSSELREGKGRPRPRPGREPSEALLRIDVVSLAWFLGMKWEHNIPQERRPTSEAICTYFYFVFRGTTCLQENNYSTDARNMYIHVSSCCLILTILSY